ncbi:hypothetical protein B0E43_04000 [Algoriphagus sp. A40]|nr:hypothetical protein B0E43_04000 [Algoriphagus sp. A40]
MFFLPGVIQAQSQIIPEDSIGFRDFLIVQKEVPGLSYRYVLGEKSISDELASDSIYQFSKTDTGYVSRLISDFDLAERLENRLVADSLDYQLVYFVFSNLSSHESTYEYLANLIRNGDYQVKFDEDGPKEDLVSLASKAPYSPLQKFKLRFFSDYQLFGVTLVIFFFFLVALGMIVFMLVMKARKNKRENLLKEYERIIIDPLTSLLFEKELKEIQEMDQNEIEFYFPQTLLSKSLYKDVLVERIIGLNKRMKGEFKDKLKSLYKKLELDKNSMDLLRNKKWDRVTMGLVQINEMDLVEALPEVKKFTNSSNFHIRSQAVAILLNLSDQVDLTFLRDQTFPISLWQQMNYLRIIRFASLQKDLKLEVLFDSQNSSIRIFGYKLVRMLGRMDLIGVLSSIAGGVAEEEKIEILETYSTLGAHMEVDFINECLHAQNPNLNLAAAKAASVLGNSESAEILFGLIKSETSFGNKLHYLKSLYELDREKFDQATLDNSSNEILKIKDHILDPMLQNV